MQGEDENSKAGFSIGDMTPTFNSFIQKSPGVIASCLFRPFVWESKKIIILFAAIEALVDFFSHFIYNDKNKSVWISLPCI